MMIQNILIVDDEPLMRQFLEQALTRKGYVVHVAENVKQAYGFLAKEPLDLILTDMKLPDASGLEVVKRAKEVCGQVAVIVMTAFGTVENAVEAMQLGALNYLLKPFTLDVLLATVKKAEEHLALVHENVYLREEIGNKRTSKKFIAQSPVMSRLLEEIKAIAKSNASVLIHGESGTGKEVVAAAIHAHSLRSTNPYIRVNCAAIPDTLIESEFFGHEKGAFTGASTKRLGRFELADKGTLLLDEVTEIPIGLQPKLLRAIQEKEFERVGGTRPTTVDVRIISTSNRNLQEAIEQKIFREDLFYRLNVVPLYLPPLRERKEDIVPLSMHYLEKFCLENRQPLKTFASDAMKTLEAYHWPGNIRELANLMERIVVRQTPAVITSAHLDIR
ncbi:MAG: sigma-54-dependent Fis family transcriptional regulator [Verrucomicrobia bacterium]|nr:sigma-54-dependent Fis family transcriptional regulator [Verrucomicrobiota bacterium]MBS0646175.1 sigma-54-dependent Fis family transcriptional regulator [Verrucomicrobiota bacterium]